MTKFHCSKLDEDFASAEREQPIDQATMDLQVGSHVMRHVVGWPLDFVGNPRKEMLQWHQVDSARIEKNDWHELRVHCQLRVLVVEKYPSDQRPTVRVSRMLQRFGR